MSTRNTDRQRFHSAPPRVAPVRAYTPPQLPLVNRASHYILAPGTTSRKGLFGELLEQVVRRYPKVRGKAAVKAAKRARISARERAAARMARRAS